MNGVWGILITVLAGAIGLLTSLCWSPRRLRLTRVLVFMPVVATLAVFIYSPAVGLDVVPTFRLCLRFVTAYIIASGIGLIVRVILVARSRGTDK